MTSTLLVTNDFPPKVGGIQSYLWELWQRLDPSSTSVLTARSHPDHAAFDAEQAARGLRIIRARSPILYLPTPFALRRIKETCALRHPNLVLLDPLFPLGLLGPYLGVPYGVILHGAEFTIPAKIPLFRRLLAATLRRASIVVCAGRYQAEEALRVSGGSARLVEIPPGVDCARFGPLTGERRAVARRRLGIPEEALLVASVSRLVPRKGMDVLIEAAARLCTDHPRLEVAIAGEGRDARRLHRAAARRRAPVRFLGRITDDEKSALLGSADVFVMACRNRWGGLEHEGFGIVFLEAGAAGLPQVAGDSGGATDAVLDHETGFVVRRPSNPDAIVAPLRSLLDDPAVRRQMGAAARARALACFDHERLAPRLAEALAEVGG